MNREFYMAKKASVFKAVNVKTGKEIPREKFVSSPATTNPKQPSEKNKK
jgi:hypothetical protein